jgi:predicted dehydrogenase
LNVAVIGVGGMGRNHLKWLKMLREFGEVNIPAVCDVDENRLAGAVKSAGAGCTPYRDYRYILERTDIDAVNIATPDHWHAVQTVHACQSGKHVFVEKPTSCTIEAGRVMVETARQYKRVVQVGSQARSAIPAWQACTALRNGLLGKVHTVTTWHGDNATGGGGHAPVPQHLDWDLWLGPLRWRQYEKGYCHGSFRQLLESGGGNIRDRGAHVMSVILWCLDADAQTPVSVETTGRPSPHGLFDCPKEMRVVYSFRDPDWQLIWEQPGTAHGPGGFGMVFHGENGQLVVCRDGTEGGQGLEQVDKKAALFRPPRNGVEVYRMNKYDRLRAGKDKYTYYNMNHKEDWLQAIKTGATPCMDIEVAHRVATLNNLGNLSYTLGRKLQWDGQKERFVGDPYANRHLGRPHRHPYHA